MLEDEEGAAKAARTAAEPWTRMSTWICTAAVLPGVAVQLAAVVPDAAAAAQIRPAELFDPGNFSANFSYVEAFNRDVNTEYQINREFRGGLNYNFSHSPKNFMPFKKIGPSEGQR